MGQTNDDVQWLNTPVAIMPEVVIGNFGSTNFPMAADGIAAGQNVSSPAASWTPPPPVYYPPPSWEHPPTAPLNEQPPSTYEYRPPQSPGYYEPPMRVYSPPVHAIGNLSSWPQRTTRFTTLSSQAPVNTDISHTRHSGVHGSIYDGITNSLTANNILLADIRPHSVIPATNDRHSILISMNGMGGIVRTATNLPLFGNVSHKTEREIEEIRKLLKDLRKSIHEEQKKVDDRAEGLVRELLKNLASSVASHVKGIKKIIEKATQAHDLVEQTYDLKNDPHLPESTIETLREAIKQYEGPEILGSEINCVGYRQMYRLDLVDRKTTTWPLNFPMVLSRAPVGSFFDEITGGDPAEMEFERAFGEAQKALNQAVADKAEEELNERLNGNDLQELIQPLIDALQEEFSAWETGGIGGPGSKGTFLKSKLEDALCSYMSNIDCAKPCSRICTLISAHIWVLHGPVRAFTEKVLLWQQKINLPSGTITKTRYQLELRIEIPFYIEGIYEVLLECI